MEKLMTANNVEVAIFDLDDTLIDTKRIKAILIETAQRECGLGSDRIWELYREARVDEGRAAFTLERFGAILADAANGNAPVDIVEKLRGEIRLHKDELFVVGAKEFLSTCTEQELSHYLVSWGVPDWQREKFALLELGKYFPDEEKIFYTDEANSSQAKISIIKDVLEAEGVQSEKAALFNDKVVEMSDIQEAYPELQLYLRFMKREHVEGQQQMLDALRERTNGTLHVDGDMDTPGSFERLAKGFFSPERRDGVRR